MPLFSWLLERMTVPRRSRRTPERKPAPRFRPRLETLEGRVVPSFTPFGIISSQTVALISGDVNGDGRPDLISANNSGNQIAVRLNNGNGTFGAASTYSGQPAFGPATELAVGTYKGHASIFVARYSGGGRTSSARR